MNQANPQTSSVPVLSYSISVTLNFLSILIFSTLIGYLFDKLADTIIALFSFILLRAFSGGYHLKSLDGCVVVTVGIMVSIPHIPMIPLITLILNIISVVLVLLLAPNNVFDEVRVSREKYPLLKIISFIIVCTNFIFTSPILTLSFFISL
ncbi:accessory regulator AgrB [Brevibacillus laterosporus]|nr:accessory regulator AgrB [Brevibacillus laterosporus]TPG91452.1 accessory regulator AgrB [Brevibacillus laterosporus]